MCGGFYFKKGGIFVKDTMISTLIVNRYFKKLRSFLELDVAIVGAGPSGLTAAYELAKKGFKVAIFEEKNTPGGGIWGGGMMFNEIVLEKELEDFLNELGITYVIQENHVLVDSVHFASALLYRTTMVGATVFNNISVEDVAMQDGKVCGVVINWGPTMRLGLHVDPITVKASFVIDGTGHPANVASLLAKRGLIEMKMELPMNADEAEQFVVENTGEIFPGLMASGMAACAVHGGPRMGPIFGGMILSGKKIAQIIEEKLR
jgi:thiamine thiazole synthase